MVNLSCSVHSGVLGSVSVDRREIEPRRDRFVPLLGLRENPLRVSGLVKSQLKMIDDRSSRHLLEKLLPEIVGRALLVGKSGLRPRRI